MTKAGVPTVKAPIPDPEIVFVQYSSDGQLGRKHLQRKDVSQHLNQWKRIDRINRLRKPSRLAGSRKIDDDSQEIEKNWPHTLVEGFDHGSSQKLGHGKNNLGDPWHSGWASIAAASARLPSKLNKDELALLQCHLSVPETAYKITGDAPVVLHRDAGMSALCRSEGFFTMSFLFASSYRDLCAGSGMSKITMQYKSKAIKLVRKAVDDPTKKYSPEAFMMVCLMTNLESKSGSQKDLPGHCQALSYIWKAIGGARGMVKSPDFDFITCCLVLIFCKGYLDSLDILAQQRKARKDYLLDIKDSMYGLLSFIPRFLKMAKDDHDGIFSFCRTSTWLSRIIIPGDMGNWPTSIGAGNAPVRHRVNDQFLLLSICYLVFKYRKSEAIDMLNRLKQILRVDQKNPVTNKFAILWVLINGFDNDPLDKWAVVDMIHSLFRFSFSSQDRVFDSLLASMVVDSAVEARDLVDDKFMKDLEEETKKNLQKIGDIGDFTLALQNERESKPDTLFRGLIHVVPLPDA